MKIIKKPSALQKNIEKLRLEGKIIGVVPTMGYLHEGHLSLLRIARKKCDVLVLTIFVNPTQFGKGEDLDRYPRDFKRDLSLARKEKVDFVFYPSVNDMYPNSYQTYVINKVISKKLEGEFRPTHFEGVTTVVAKLFNIVKPHIAVFGQKDYQQAQIIKSMVKDLNFDVKIILAPIIRESDGLAMSSRNVYLSLGERNEALALNKSLLLAEDLIKKGERNCRLIIQKMKNFISKNKSIKIDYIKVADLSLSQYLKELKNNTTCVILLAARVGNTRLIDNKIIRIGSK
ncbi:MAG TPA: pantoate--beta-alanine ligase [Ignavibacteria bacterium]